MKEDNYKMFYRGRLPHIQPLGASFFVTFRLKDSIPRVKILKLKEEYEESKRLIEERDSIDLKNQLWNARKRFFKEYDNLLDSINTGPHYLKRPDIAEMVMAELHRFDGELYRMAAFCVMSNHVHILIDTQIKLSKGKNLESDDVSSFEPLCNIMKRIKGPTAVYENRLLKRSGGFWQEESFDHYIRNGREFGNVVAYILNNPVKAGLVKDWKDYPFSYVRKEEDA